MDGKLNNFLGFFKKIVLSKEDLKNSIIRIVKQKANLELKEENVEIKKTSLHFNISQTLKSHLFIKKDEILDAFRKEKIPISSINW